MGVPIPVDGVTPQRISQAVSSPYLITALATNSGPVYLGLDSSVSPLNFAYPLAPGSSLTWTSISSDVWAIMDAGGTGAVIQAYEASGTASPGYSTVTSKLSNAPTLIYSHSELVPNTVGAHNINGAIFDVSEYASIIFVLTCDILPSGINLNNYVELRAIQYDNPSALANGYISQETAQWLIDITGYNLGPPDVVYNTMRLQVPVLQATMSIAEVINIGAPSFVSPANFGISVYGSNESINTPRYVNATGSFLGMIPFGGAFTRSVVGIIDSSVFVASINGVAKLTYTNNTAAGIGFAQVSYLDDGGIAKPLGLAPITTGGASITSSLELILPMRPIYQRTYANTAGASMLTALMQ